MLEQLQHALEDAEDLVSWAAGLSMPDDPQDFINVAMRHAQDYPFAEGDIVSDSGVNLGVDTYEDRFAEEHRAHSTALFSLLDGQPYLVGPLARINLNLDRLPDSSRALLERSGVSFPSNNMFHSLLARAVEIHVAIIEAMRLLGDYRVPESPYVDVTPRAGVGFGATEAPRGLLWHRYEIDANGIIRAARIVPPTSQNQARIEADLHRSLLTFGLHKSDDDLRLRAETVIRNYDPCISCATHFLRLDCQRR